MTSFNPTKLPTQRLKVWKSGIISNKWSVIDGNGLQVYTANPNLDQVELKSHGGLVSVALLPSPAWENNLFKEVEFEPILLQTNKQSKWTSRLRKHLIRPQILLNINFSSMFCLDFTCPLPFDITCNKECLGFEIHNICEFFQWRGWQIYSPLDRQRPLLRFIWFGSKNKGGPMAGVEFYSSFSKPVAQALLTVVMAFFTECFKSESPPSSPLSSPRTSQFFRSHSFNLPFTST